MMKHFAAGAAMVLFATAAHAADVTPDNLQGWSAANVRSQGSVEITGTYARDGVGSLEFITTASNANPAQDKADYVNYSINGTLGDLLSEGALSYDYYVDGASTVAGHLAPALRLAFQTEDSKVGYLIWEPTYNAGGAVATDTWVTNNILSGNFWMRAIGAGGTIEQYGVSLSDWAGGASFTGSHVLNSNTLIRGIEVGVGSGWNGDFHGAVDNVKISFGANGTGLNANFETGVPEPTTWALMILGFGGAGAMLRRRRTLAHAA